VRSSGLLVLASAVLAVTMTAAQSAQTQPPPRPRDPGAERDQDPTIRERKPFHSSVEVIAIAATVVDAEGHFVTGLPREAFEVSEDGKPQPITQFTNERVPLSMGVLLDISDSMYGQRIKDARATVQHFLFDLLTPADEFFLLAFNHEPKILTEWTSEQDAIQRALDGLRPSGATAIYDAVLKALPLTERRSRPRAALLIISDGADTASDATLREVRSTLLRSDVFVYAIAIDSPQRQPINTRVSPEALTEITNPSGGRTEVVQDGAGLLTATARIADELNSQYLIGYTPPRPADGQYHSIHLRVTQGGYRARARNGYVAAPLPSTR
jgi:Ca-activated chloride channel family protein